MSTLKTDNILTVSGLANRGKVIQVVTSSTTNSIQASNAVFTGATGGVAPTSTQGAEFHSFSFTPLRSDSTIFINSTNLSISEAWNYSDVLWGAAFAGTSLIVASSCPVGYYVWGGSYNSTFVNLVGSIASWGTSARTISIRFGAGNNGASSGGYGIGANNDYYYNSQAGGVNTVSFQMMEVAP